MLVRRMLEIRIATKDNLYMRGVISQGMLNCVGDCVGEETVSHLFFESHSPMVLEPKYLPWFSAVRNLISK